MMGLLRAVYNLKYYFVDGTEMGLLFLSFIIILFSFIYIYYR
jgi:hypothetical protein